MRALAIIIALGVAACLVPVVTADVAVRTCNMPTSCQEVASLPAPVDCNVDIMKKGLGKPPGVRVSECA